MATAFQVNAFQNNAFQIDAGVTPPVTARQFGGGIAKKRRRRKTVVEIDGETFIVYDEAEAQALIDSAQELAQQQAVAAAKTALNRARKVRHKTGTMPALEVAVPEIRIVSGGYPDISELVTAAQRAMDEIYLRAAQTAELAWLAHREAFEQDEDDVAILLLH